MAAPSALHQQAEANCHGRTPVANVFLWLYKIILSFLLSLWHPRLFHFTSLPLAPLLPRHKIPFVLLSFLPSSSIPNQRSTVVSLFLFAGSTFLLLLLNFDGSWKKTWFLHLLSFRFSSLIKCTSIIGSHVIKKIMLLLLNSRAALKKKISWTQRELLLAFARPGFNHTTELCP